MPKSVFTDAYAAVVEYLVELRKTQGVSQVELAQRLGRTQQFVSLVERKDRRLDIIEFLVWVRALEGNAERALVDVARLVPDDLAI